MDTSYTGNRRQAGADVQSNRVSEGRAALDDDILCSEFSGRPTPIPVPRRSRGLVTYPTFDEAESLAADSVGERSMANCCSRTHNQRITNFHHIYFSDMARSDHSKVLGYRPIHAITRFWRARPVFRTTLISYGAGH